MGRIIGRFPTQTEPTTIKVGTIYVILALIFTYSLYAAIGVSIENKKPKLLIKKSAQEN